MNVLDPDRELTAHSRILSWKMDKVQLGAGTFGTVWKCVALVEDAATKERKRLLLALKQFEDAREHGHPFSATPLREIVPLLSLPRHPSILRLHAVVLQKGKLCMLSDCHVMNLRQFLLQCRPQGLASHELKLMAHDILTGIAHMHSHRIVHRDFKLENILVTKAGRCVIADFGMAKTLDGRTTFLDSATGEVCSLWTRAPEICLNVGAQYGPAMDVWAAGAVLLALAKGDYALKSAREGNDFLYRIFSLLGKPTVTQWPILQRAIDKGDGFASLPAAAFPFYGRRSRIEQVVGKKLDPDFLSLLETLLEVVPEKRITAMQALGSKWLVGASQIARTSLVHAVLPQHASMLSFETRSPIVLSKDATLALYGEGEDGMHPCSQTPSLVYSRAWLMDQLLSMGIPLQCARSTALLYRRALCVIPCTSTLDYKSLAWACFRLVARIHHKTIDVEAGDFTEAKCLAMEEQIVRFFKLRFPVAHTYN